MPESKTIAISEQGAALLRKVSKHIAEVPARLEMRSFGQKLSTFIDGVYIGPHRFPRPACGTVACIAGWVVLLGTPREVLGFDPFKPTLTPDEHSRFQNLMGSAAIRAQELLGISQPQAELLFFTTNWPFVYLRDYLHAETPEQREAATRERIEHFIRTGL